METFLDLLIVVVMGIIALSFVSILLMFMVKNDKVKHFFFYITVLLGIYMGYVGFRILWFGFTEQYILSMLMGILAIASFVLSRKEEYFKIAQAMASVSLVIGMINAFI